MKELFEQKRLASENALEEAEKQGKIENIEESKNLQLAHENLLRKAKE